MQSKPDNLILICGDEVFLAEQKKNELLESLSAEGSINFNSFTGENLDLDEIKRLIDTMPLFEDKRKILISDSGLFKGNAGNEAAEEVFDSIPDTAAVIFIEKEVQASSSLYKLVKKNGVIYRFESAESKKGAARRESETQIRAFVRERIKAESKKIDMSTVNYLTQLSGYDMLNLSTEIEKLICYTLSKPPGYTITVKDVDAICSRTLTDKVFVMIDEKLKGNIGEAIRILEELFAIKTAPMKIIFMISKQYEQALCVKEAISNGVPDAQIMSKLDMKDWQFKRVRDQVRNISLRELSGKLEHCVDMEYRIKSGSIPDRLAAELMIIR